jgi:hypothetical protein
LKQAPNKNQTIIAFQKFLFIFLIIIRIIPKLSKSIGL